MNKLGGALLLLGALVAFGCGASSRMTNLWSDAEYQGGPMHEVLVIAVRKDGARRRIWEDNFARELAARGVHATQSYTLWDDVPDTDVVAQTVQARGFDAVLVNARLEPGEETTVIPGYTTRQPVSRYNPWTQRYHTYWKDVVVPDRVETTTVRRFRTDVWSGAGEGRLVWTGTLETIEAADPGLVRDAIDKDILPALERSGLVPKRA